MNDRFPPLHLKLLEGSELLRNGTRSLGFTLLEFWRWSASDLVNNATRGVLAEFIVASALGVPFDRPRESWAACDIEASPGITIEVRSSAYLQSWHQKRLSPIIFKIPKTRAWNSSTNEMEPEPRRKATVYVFALLAHQEKATIDPFDVAQWLFYVLPTSALDARSRSQHSITLRSLEHLAGRAVLYEELNSAVEEAVKIEPVA